MSSAYSSAALCKLIIDRRDQLVDRAIEVAKEHGYTRYTTTIRAAWIEAVDSLSEAVCAFVMAPQDAGHKPEAEVDYLRDPRFATMRAVARRHRSLGVTLQLYTGLFKHFRDIFLDLVDELPAPKSNIRAARKTMLGFFDAAELSVFADWAGETEDDLFKELQARTRSITLEKDRYFSVFESLRDPAFLLDRERRLINANQAAAEIFVGEASAGDIVYLRSMRSRRMPLERILREASRSRKNDGRPVWLETKNGQRCFDVRERAIHDAVENTKLGYVAILHDVTQHRRATEDAERAQRAMSNFLATISHEIRTPLHSVLGATTLLHAAETERREAYIDVIESAGRHLLQTLNKVLDYSKLEARPPTPTPQRWKLSEVFDEYRQVASVWARQADVPLTVSIARNLPEYISIDWEMTQQVLTNLVSNAIRHDTGGGVTVLVRRRKKTAGDKYLRFEVRDTGPGVAQHTASMLFEPFGTLTPATSGGCGTGLGLAISRRLVEAMGGEIGFSNRSSGASFWFDLPYRRVDAKMAADSAIARPVSPTANPGARPKCLVIDDDVLGIMITADQLRRQGIEVTTALSASDAIAAAKQVSFDGYFIDYYLADGNGAWLAAELRRMAKAGNPSRYIALTANADMIDTGRGLDAHIFDVVLSKPVTDIDLICALDPHAGTSTTGHAPTIMSDPTALDGVSPRVIGAMASAFANKWDKDVATLEAALNAGEAVKVADIAHRLSGRCAVMGICDLADLLRGLETECRRRPELSDFAAWQARLASELRIAPDRARAMAEAAP